MAEPQDEGWPVSRFQSGATVAAIAIVLAATGVAAQSPPASPATIGQAADSGARIVLVEPLDDVTSDLTIESPAVGTVQVRLLLPEGFVDDRQAMFPTLYILHGGGGGYVDWTKETNVAAITAGSGLLVAMPAAASSNLGTWLPEGGPDGTGGPPNWEVFHLVELPQLLERNWRAGEERLVAGLSLGGYGAVMYAGRHPGFFDAAASYSGVLDLTITPDDSDEAKALVEQVTAYAEAAGWGQANPINLVADLEETDLYVSYGDGDPDPLDEPGTEHDRLEAWVGDGAERFVAALADADVAATTRAYGPGTHSWPYWERELAASMPTLMNAIGRSADDASG